MLSTKTRESIKTALAMTLAYAVALAMDWPSPHWAGIAVAVVSLARVGQSLNKGAMRMFGTLVAATVALALIALAPQQRWLFMTLLSAWVGFCTYMSMGPRLQYFWMVSGFVCVIVCMAAGPDPANAFQTAVLRAKETGLGILAYSLVTVLLWPTDSRAGFYQAAASLVAAQREAVKTQLALIGTQGDAAQARAAGAKAIQAQAPFDQQLEAAESDSYEVREVRRRWRYYQSLSTQLGGTLQRCGESLAGIRAPDVETLFPNLPALAAELDRRFDGIEAMLNGQAPVAAPDAVSITAADTEIPALPAFDLAALAVTVAQLRAMESLTRSMYDTLADIRGFGPAVSVPDTPPPPGAGPFLDPDRIAGVIQVMASMWIAYLILIYVGDIPGGPTFVTMCSALSMVLASAPQLPASMLLRPVGGSVAFGGFVHLFVMPQLTTFFGLGALIFLGTFAIGYLFSAPRQALSRVFGLVMFIVVAGIDNQQSYSFLGVAITGLMMMLVLGLLIATAHLPYTPRPELAFLRLTGRFFHSAGFLLSTLNESGQRGTGTVERWRRAFHAREVATLPRKLAAWAKFMRPGATPGTSPEQVQAQLASLQALSVRLQLLLEEAGSARAGVLTERLSEDLHAWHAGIQQILRALASGAGVVDGDTAPLRAGADRLQQRVEARVAEAAATPATEVRDAGEAANLMRLLGAFRSVSDALIDYAGNAASVDWARWREERFA